MPSLFQVSMPSALIAGVLDGAMSVTELRSHGDFGLGTFADLDGEMVLLEGTAFQAKSDGSVREAPNALGITFACVTNFVADAESGSTAAADIDALEAQFTKLRGCNNAFYALRADGDFEYLYLRAVCKSGTSLVQAASAQGEFEARKVSGTVVGLWTPVYASALGVQGYHLHFLSNDRTHGGHVLRCSASAVQLQVQRLTDYHLVLPRSTAFLNADLQNNSAQLLRIENESK